MVRVENETDWCILRMRGASTLPLAESLKEAGFDVWTPIEKCERRVGRRRREIETTVAAMTTFVFARWKHLTDMLLLAASPTSPHRDFSVMQRDGGFVRISDRALEPLREFELSSHMGHLKRTAPKWEPGDFVRAPDTAFAGLNGQVLETKGGKHVLIVFGDHFEVEIAPWQLVPAPVEVQHPITGIAA